MKPDTKRLTPRSKCTHINPSIGSADPSKIGTYSGGRLRDIALWMVGREMVERGLRIVFA